MSLQDVSLPKKYKDGDVLFEQTLDAWRQATEQAFATMNLNFTQLAKDLFPSDYDYNNDGNQTESKSLQEQITDVITGATPITGTSADSFTINTDGNSSTLTTASLSAIRTHALPDISGTFMMLEGAQTVSGAKTFASATFDVLGIKIKGAGVGVASLQYANSADSRYYTIPDAGAAADFVMTAGPQTITGIKTFNVGTLKLGGAGVGIALLKNGNNTVDTTFQFPVLAAATYTIGIVGQLDWDTAWLDAVHDHSSDADGGAIPWASVTADPNLTYDNVAESIGSVWEFTSGAGFGSSATRVAVNDNGIYLEGDAIDARILYLNYVGYNGGTTKYRHLAIGDGKNKILFGCNGNQSLPSVYIDHDVNLYTSDSYTLANNITVDGFVIGLDRQVTPSSLCKAWVSFHTDASSPVVTTVDYSYNCTVATSGADPNEEFLITFTKPFAHSSYVVNGNVSIELATGAAGIIVLERNTTNCLIRIINPNGDVANHNVIGMVSFYGVLA